MDREAEVTDSGSAKERLCTRERSGGDDNRGEVAASTGLLSGGEEIAGLFMVVGLSRRVATHFKQPKRDMPLTRETRNKPRL